MPEDGCWKRPLACSAGVSFCAWLYMIDCSSSTKPLFASKKNMSTQAAVWLLCTDTYITAQSQLESDQRTNHSPYTVSLNQWFHLCFTLDSSAGSKIYVNGLLANSASIQGGGASLTEGGPDVIIGDGLIDTAPNAGASAHFKIDEFAVWNKTLSSAEVSAIVGTYP